MVENLFTINLEVLLSVLYSWRSLQTTGRIKLKSRARRLKPKTENPRKLLTTWNINKRSSKSLPTYTETNHHPKANKFQSKTYHTNSSTTQEHSPERQHTGCLKSHLTQTHLKTHYWTLHCTPERRNPIPRTRTLTQASLISKPWQTQSSNPTHWVKPPQ